MKKKHLIVVFILFILLTFSCSERHVYQKYKKIPDYMWHNEHKVHFTFTIKDTTCKYNIYLNLRIATYYPYSNIWINYTKKYQKSIDAQSNLLEYTLTDEKGKWLGKGLGDLYDYQFILEESVIFPKTGKYTYTFNHEMRIDHLPSVMDLGLMVKKVMKD